MNWVQGYKSRLLFTPDGPGGSGGPITGGIRREQPRPQEQQQERRVQTDPEAGRQGDGQGEGGQGDGGGGGEDENFLETNADLWSGPERREETAAEIAARENLQRDRSTQTNTRLDGYVNGLDFGFQIKPEDLTAFFDNRDPKGLADAVTGSLRSAYRNMMVDATRMIDGAMGSLRREMASQADNRIRESESVSSLMETVPFANTPALKPVAIAIQKQFLQKGKTLQEANAMVKRFFKETAQSAAGDLELDIAPRSGDGSRPNGARGNSGRRSPDINWGDILTGKQ